MLNKFLISIFFSVFALGASADDIKINPDRPDKYVVVKGDTLWDISARFLEQPWRWPEIWQVNPQIENPHLIYPGDLVYMTFKDGMPVLNVDRGGIAATTESRTVKLSPEVRSTPHAEAIHSIPVDAIQQFLTRPLVLDDNDLEYWPYVVSSYDQHLIAATGNTIYVRGISEEDQERAYSIYRKGEAYLDPADSERKTVLGYEAIYVGDAILEQTGDPASLLVTGVDREILIGDRLVPQSNEDISAEFIPTTTSLDVNGKILSVVDGVSQIGQFQIIVLSMGNEQGIEPGNVVGIYQSGQIVRDTVGPNLTKSEKEKMADADAYEATDPSDIQRTLKKITEVPGALAEKFDNAFPHFANKQSKSVDVELPEEYVGVAMVFRTYSKVSYALVMETIGAVHVMDTVKSM